MWRPEFSDGKLALLRLPIERSAAATGRPRAPSIDRCRDAGAGLDLHDRFVGGYLLYGGGRRRGRRAEANRDRRAAGRRQNSSCRCRMGSTASRRWGRMPGGRLAGRDVVFSAIELTAARRPRSATATSARAPRRPKPQPRLLLQARRHDAGRGQRHARPAGRRAGEPRFALLAELRLDDLPAPATGRVRQAGELGAEEGRRRRPLRGLLRRLVRQRPADLPRRARSSRCSATSWSKAVSNAARIRELRAYEFRAHSTRPRTRELTGPASTAGVKVKRAQEIVAHPNDTI